MKTIDILRFIIPNYMLIFFWNVLIVVLWVIINVSEKDIACPENGGDRLLRNIGNHI